MESATQSADALRKQIAATEQELVRLKEHLASVEALDGIKELKLEEPSPVTNGKWPLSSEEYKRYGRQMIVPSIGIQGKTALSTCWNFINLIIGQIRLKSASVLLIGAGGLGCPAA